MILEIQDPGWDFTSLFISGGTTLAVLGVLALITYKKSDSMRENDWFAVWTGVVLFLGVIVVGMGGVGVGSSAYQEKIRVTKIQALEDLGFDRVDLYSTDLFVASYNGKYFDGMLIEDGDLRWKIAEVLPPVILEESK